MIPSIKILCAQVSLDTQRASRSQEIQTVDSQEQMEAVLGSDHGVTYSEIEPDTYELTAEKACVLADDSSPVFIPSAWNVVISTP